MSTMQVTREELNPCTIKLDIVCSPEQVSEGFGKAYKAFAKRMKVPGFRPGSAPKAMLEKIVPKEDLYNTAADEIVRLSLKKAIDEQKIEPSDAPSVRMSKLEEDPAACEFSAKVPLKPIVELSEYVGLAAEKPPVDVSDEEVDRQVDELRRRSGDSEAITDRGAEDGDVAVVNIRVEGQEGDGRTFMSIVGQTFPELDLALHGMVAEEMKKLELTFPKSFQEKDWAGKTENCQVTLRNLSAVRLPDLTDEFAKKLSTESVDELKARVREAIVVAKENMARDYVQEQFFDQIMAKSTVHVPDTMWEPVAARRLNDIQAELNQQKKSVEDYAKENGMTIESLVEAWQHEAHMHVKRAVVIREIFAKEDMRLNNQDLNRELIDMANEYKMHPKDLFEAMKKNRSIHELEFRAIFRKVMDFLHEKANITEVAAKA